MAAGCPPHCQARRACLPVHRLAAAARHDAGPSAGGLDLARCSRGIKSPAARRKDAFVSSPSTLCSPTAKCRLREMLMSAGVFLYPNPQNRIHVTEKPLQLMRDVVQICEPGGRILDPLPGRAPPCWPLCRKAMRLSASKCRTPTSAAALNG